MSGGAVAPRRGAAEVATVVALTHDGAGVVRDGEQRRVPATEVVVGDVLALTEGDAVPADARLVDARVLTVAEASLTGESEPVLKDVVPVPDATATGHRLATAFSDSQAFSGSAD